MKKLLLLICLLLFMAYSPAQAAPLVGGNVSMDVPEGWSTQYLEKGLDEFRLTAPENQFRMSLMLGPSQGMTPKQGAELIAGKIGGDEPKPTRNPGMYSFRNAKGVRCMTLVRGKRMLVVMESGKGGPLQEQIALIYHSLSSSDPDEQAMFDSIKPFFDRWLPKSQ